MSDIISPGQKAALIINEAQLGIMDPRHCMFPQLAQQVAERQIIPRIVALAEAFRKKKWPVIHTPVMHRPDFVDMLRNSLINALSAKTQRLAKGSIEADYIEALRPKPEDLVIDRTAGLIAFNGTSLDTTLRRLGVATIVLTGVSTNLAMPGNAMAAVDFGYHVIVPEDCIAGSDPVVHQTIVESQLRLLARITSSAEVIAAVAAA